MASGDLKFDNYFGHENKQMNKLGDSLVSLDGVLTILLRNGFCSRCCRHHAGTF